jgi:SNF2 family DNA or RNA helicase
LRDKDVLLSHSFHLLILDEAHHIKNSKAISTQIVMQLKARHRLCLTGTPMENHLGELWSLFHFLMPGFLGNEAFFKRTFRTPIEKHADNERRMALNRRIAPFLLRRTKDVVAKELPPKTEMIRYIELQDAQRDLYESIRVAMEEKVRKEIEKLGLARSHIVILDALLKLRQVCCDPRLLKMNSPMKQRASSAKIDLLKEILPELIEEGRRILIFSSFREMLVIIEELLHTLNIPYTQLTGKTLDRPKAIERFTSGEVPVFLISLKAGGVGLNLTSADTVIHVDPWWNPAAENQATDRAYRIGQDKPVFVYKLVTKDTVEEKIIAMQAKKQSLADSIYSDKAMADANITEDDLKMLFSPL